MMNTANYKSKQVEMKWVGKLGVPMKAVRTDTTDGGFFSDISEE